MQYTRTTKGRRINVGDIVIPALGVGFSGVVEAIATEYGVEDHILIGVDWLPASRFRNCKDLW
jgi:hypothetical protein